MAGCSPYITKNYGDDAKFFCRLVDKDWFNDGQWKIEDDGAIINVGNGGQYLYHTKDDRPKIGAKDEASYWQFTKANKPEKLSPGEWSGRWKGRMPTGFFDSEGERESCQPNYELCLVVEPDMSLKCSLQERSTIVENFTGTINGQGEVVFEGAAPEDISFSGCFFTVKAGHLSDQKQTVRFKLH